MSKKYALNYKLKKNNLIKILYLLYYLLFNLFTN
jgi:hypothetical protein